MDERQGPSDVDKDSGGQDEPVLVKVPDVQDVGYCVVKESEGNE